MFAVIVSLFMTIVVVTAGLGITARGAKFF